MGMNQGIAAWFRMAVLAGATASAIGASPAAAEEIKIGVPLSLTGPVAFAGVKMRDAMEIAFEHVEKSGMLGDLKLVPIYMDDQSSQPTGISITQQLALRNRVSAIVGYTASNICQAALPVAQELKVPTLNGDCVVDGLGKIGNYVYNTVRPSDSFLEQLVAKIAAGGKFKTGAVLYQRENPLFANLAPVVTAAFKKAGIKVVATEAVTSGADADFSAQLTNIAGTKPDVLAILLLGGQTGPAFVQARQAGLTDTVFIGVQNFDSDEVRRVAGAAAKGALYPSQWIAESPLDSNKQFVAEYRKRFNREPDTFSANGYNSVLMLAQIIKKAGSGDREKIREAIETIGEMDTIFGTNGKTHFEDRLVALTPFFFEMQADGSVKLLD
ncbi:MULTISPECIES: ABC transporter substrate-binding protein [unclassified Chelatococcus]|uniref:ABC transporter substrate-binding protein n=1 Tax=unclassified Chelatococcus TaxID=2638111 RepID=UPI001BCE265B|nr:MULTISPECIES: ABC transporter substrate-binding protein [unclassified Chelatococcus]MBS7700621.1 ABC transporter substrate-binding protein [Chelatococcus sp. YT9]MBX3559052.1 ABC transporter substrate-binding protein [Chelatococcus sp.]